MRPSLCQDIRRDLDAITDQMYRNEIQAEHYAFYLGLLTGYLLECLKELEKNAIQSI